MSIDLGRRLIAAGLVSPEEVEAALFLSVARGLPLPRVLIDRGAISERALEVELERVGGLALRQVTGAAEVVKRLPRAMCRRLAALPTRVDPVTGSVDVAAADPLDAHVAAEFSFHLGQPIRVLRAPIAVVEEAIRRLELDEGEPATRARERRVTPPFPHGAPQSSIPPPIAEEAPIPLVRKLAPSAPATSEDRELPRSGGTLVPPSGAPPIAMPGQLIPKGRPTPAPDTSPSAGTNGPSPERRHVALSELEDEPPSVSFPSMPPQGERTPPYGSPAFDAAALSDAPTYRIAPPAEDAYRARDRRNESHEGAVPPSALGPKATPQSAAPPAALSSLSSAELASAAADPRSTLVSASEQRPMLKRRSSRPSLAAVPYPAPAPPPAPPPPEEDDDEPPPPPPRRRVRAPDGAPTLDALARASSRDEVIRLAMRGMRLTARRLAVFAVRKDGFYGWSCNVDFGDEEALRALYVPSDIPSVLATATATAMYLGPIPATPAHEGLLSVIERSSADVAAVAVRVAGRPVLVLLCDELEDTMVSTRFLTELAKAVGDALGRLIAR